MISTLGKPILSTPANYLLGILSIVLLASHYGLGKHIRDIKPESLLTMYKVIGYIAPSFSGLSILTQGS